MLYEKSLIFKTIADGLYAKLREKRELAEDDKEDETVYRDNLYDTFISNCEAEKKQEEDIDDGDENIKESFVEGPKHCANPSLKPHGGTAMRLPKPSDFIKIESSQKPKEIVMKKIIEAKHAVIPPPRKDKKLAASDGKISKAKAPPKAGNQRVGASDRECIIF